MHPESGLFNKKLTTYKKRGCLTSACLTSWPSTAIQNNRQSNHPRWSILSRKVCMEVQVPPAHYGEHIQHSVAVTLAFCFCSVFECGSSEVQKQSVSNAFSYVVLCKTLLSSFKWAILADTSAKIQNLGESKGKRAKSKILVMHPDIQRVLPSARRRR